jgi:hypothetical protein
MKNFVILSAIIFLFFSCKHADTMATPVGNVFYFTKPQPINDSELNSFPNKFKGIYMNSDSVILKISDEMMYNEFEYKYRFHKNQRDSLLNYFDMIDGKYISKHDNGVYTSKIIGDSIEFTNIDIDTLFKFSDSQKAKRINGNLVLNQKDSIFWTVKMLTLSKNKLTIKQLFSDDDLKRIDSITKIHSKIIDSTSFILAPKRSEFLKFFKLKNLGYDSEFTKISN